MFTRSIVIASVLFGCASEPADPTPEIVDNLILAGFPENDIMVVDGLVYVGRDAEVSLEASREMLDADVSAEGKEQYRTTNLVSSGNRNICVNGSQFTGKFSDALNRAIANYNALSGSTIRLTRVTSGSNCITARISSGTGGSAGFPSGGRAFGTINIGSGLNSFDVNTVEHVITHELGHCIGFRHSDYFNRSISCGSGGNEGSAGVGAIHIPGTPTGASVGGSIMNSCFRSLETGEFTGSDVTAMNTMY
jgi:hypothetical protein